MEKVTPLQLTHTRVKTKLQEIPQHSLYVGTTTIKQTQSSTIKLIIPFEEFENN